MDTSLSEKLQTPEAFGESFYGVVKGIKCSSVSAILTKTMRSEGGKSTSKKHGIR